jgi:glycosyltransferase involved in cell wall biosynthesis
MIAAFWRGADSLPRMPTNVLLLRGHHPTVWGLRPFERLPERFAVRLAVTGRPHYSLDGLELERVPVRTVRDTMPGGTLGSVVTLGLPDRVLHAERTYASADIVHAEELSLWFTAQAARLKARLGYRLVVTVWETLPLLDAFRNLHGRRYRATTLAAADLFMAVSQHAYDSLLLEGVPEERVMLAPHGIDLDRFAQPRIQGVREHVILSPARLEWEKGHHDILRAVAALKQGLVPAPAKAVEGLRLMLVGAGPEEKRLRTHAAELEIADAVTIGRVPYEEMPALYARASALVLASLPRSGCSLYPGDIPRCFWEEQFGMVLAEAMAAGVPMIVSTSGAIPEVAGDRARYFAPGDWMAIARALAQGPLSSPPATPIEYPPALLQNYSVQAAAQRIAAAFDRVLDGD